MSYKALNGCHLKTDFCRWGAESKRRRLVEEEARAGAVEEADFIAYGIFLTLVTAFRYLGQVILD